jgi:two-component system, NtrC family, response regulator HydG
MMHQDLNAYWKTVVDTIQDGVMIVDTNGIIMSVNRALEEMSGYRREEMIGKSCATLNCSSCKVVREDKKGSWCSLFETGTLKMTRCAFMRKDYSHVPVLKNASLLYDNTGQLLGAVETMTDISEIVKKDTQIEAFRRELRSEDTFHGITGTSAAMQRIFDMVTNAAQSDAPVIILGESGTGKELVARAIHDISSQGQDTPYVKVNCAALNESLLESELFGHVKGAFTGAHRDREGRFEAAEGGDIFLDEIGDLPLSTQVKLLRVLEEKVVERVGDHRPIPIHVRIISATNRNLVKLVSERKFREDLFYRINVIPIHIPPLRERVTDIPILAEAMFRKIQLKNGRPINGISADAMTLLMRHSWPGNVRELKSAFEYAFVACNGPMIEPHHLPASLSTSEPAINLVKQSPRMEKIDNQESLIDALKKAGGNQSLAAEILGVTRVTVWNRMKRYGIDLKKVVQKESVF